MTLSSPIEQLEHTRQQLGVDRRALEAKDLLLHISQKDFAKTMFEPLGLELVFSKVAIKPGKPVWLGKAGATLVMGLPGNPTSALVTGRLLLAHLLCELPLRLAVPVHLRQA